MSKKTYPDNEKKRLGNLLKETREKSGDFSQRTVAKTIGIPNSTLKYFEDGTSVPTASTFKKLITFLNPDPLELMLIEESYSKLKGTPPPDICEFMINNPNLYVAFRKLKINKLNNDQINQIVELFLSFDEIDLQHQ